MKIGILIPAAAALALTACGSNQPAVQADNVVVDNMALDPDTGAPDNLSTDTGVPDNGQEYAAMAAAGDMYEIESSKLAIAMSKNAALKELAQMIVTDHEKATAGLQKAAGEAQPPITVAPAMNDEQKANMDALRAAAATRFDQVYLNQQVAAHEKALTMVQSYAATGEVAALKAHAGMVAGPIQKHLDQAKKLQSTR